VVCVFRQKRFKTENTMKTKIEKLYLEYVDNFLTVVGFANYYDIDEVKANKIINLGRKIHHWNWTNKQLK
jgi:hypothetical protein